MPLRFLVIEDFFHFQDKLLPESKEESFGRKHQFDGSFLASLDEGISPTESLISQETLDFIFQRFTSSQRKDFTVNYKVPETSLHIDKFLYFISLKVIQRELRTKDSQDYKLI